MITLESERLILRPFEERDVGDYAAMCADPEVMRFLGGKTWTRMEAWRHVATMLGHWHLRGYGMWALVDRHTGVFLGRAGAGVRAPATGAERILNRPVCRVCPRTPAEKRREVAAR